MLKREGRGDTPASPNDGRWLPVPSSAPEYVKLIFYCTLTASEDMADNAEFNGF